MCYSSTCPVTICTKNKMYKPKSAAVFCNHWFFPNEKFKQIVHPWMQHVRHLCLFPDICFWNIHARTHTHTSIYYYFLQTTMINKMWLKLYKQWLFAIKNKSIFKQTTTTTINITWLLKNELENENFKILKRNF
jgi:phage terminase large subunit GpA-like protein